MFVDTVNTGVCGSMRCENSAFGLSTLSIQIWVEHFEYQMKSLPSQSGLSTLSIQIWVEHFEYQMKSLPSQSGLSTLSIEGSSGTDVVLLKTESKERAYVDTVDTDLSRTFWQCWQTRYHTQYTVALLWPFVLTVLTNKIPYSIHNSIALIFCIDSVDKQDTLLNT